MNASNVLAFPSPRLAGRLKSVDMNSFLTDGLGDAVLMVVPGTNDDYCVVDAKTREVVWLLTRRHTLQVDHIEGY